MLDTEQGLTVLNKTEYLFYFSRFLHLAVGQLLAKQGVHDLRMCLRCNVRSGGGGYFL